MPFISVVVPTYQRLAMLQRALRSVQAQSFADWELIISDDEDPPGETWAFLQTLPPADPRIRILRNPGPHGQCGNVNNALRAAQSQWIKPLFDDDALRPQCLETFAKAVARCPTAIMASCRLAVSVQGAVREEPAAAAALSAGRPPLELIPQRSMQLGMYLQEDVGLGIPTQVMVRRDCIERGAVFEQHPGLVSSVDTLWYMRILQHGDHLLINRVLAEQYQGEHVTVTSRMTDEAIDREFALIRQLQYPLVDPSLHPPSLSVSLQAIRLVRAAASVRKGRYLRAARLVCGAWRPQAWRLAIQWLRRQRWPASAGLSHIQRLPVDASGL